MDAITAKHRDGDTVVLVSHGAVLRMGALALARNVGPSLAEAGLLPNTGRVVLERERGGDGWRCTSWTGVDVVGG